MFQFKFRLNEFILLLAGQQPWGDEPAVLKGLKAGFIQWRSEVHIAVVYGIHSCARNCFTPSVVSLSRYIGIKRPPHPLAITGVMCKLLPRSGLMTGLEHFISGQATTQCHQVRVGCHTSTPSQSKFLVCESPASTYLIDLSED